MGWLGPMGVCVLKGGDFATSRMCPLRIWPRSLDLELWLLTLTRRTRRPALVEGRGGISGNQETYMLDISLLHPSVCTWCFNNEIKKITFSIVGCYNHKI